LHYASPPTIGGVESTLASQAIGLSDRGYQVRVISGRGESFDPRIELQIDPIFSSTHPTTLAIKAALDTGYIPTEFYPCVAQLQEKLEHLLQDCSVCIVHNAHTLNKHLPLTAALARLEHPKLIAWCHDLAWTNPQYLPELHRGYPWDLLRTPWQNSRYVTISEPRRIELAQLLGVHTDSIPVIPPGIDPARFFQWTPLMYQIETTLRLLDADGILLLPARLTRRKNIAFGLQSLAALRAQSARDYRLIITGPPGPHNPLNPGYLGELLTLCETLDLKASAHFLYQYQLIPDDPTMANLYTLADALLFPSFQEGFGIPLLEAGLTGLPIFCSNLPPFHHIGQMDVSYFDPIHDAPSELATRIQSTLEHDPRARLRIRTRKTARWDAIIRQQLIPLLEQT
jgi:glycosyltransferase involved in cell wall biosynthesis